MQDRTQRLIKNEAIRQANRTQLAKNAAKLDRPIMTGYVVGPSSKK